VVAVEERLAAGLAQQDARCFWAIKEHVTTHYSAPETGALIEASDKVCALRSRKSPKVPHSQLCERGEVQAVESMMVRESESESESESERGTRTLELGIMRALSQ
jgi:hypothetical protein